MSDAKPITVTFPSGRQITLPPMQPTTGRQADVAAPKRRAKPCQHIGGPVAVNYGCGSLPKNGIWECPIKGTCAPLSLIELRAGVTACATCDLYIPAKEPGLLRLVATRHHAIKQWEAAGKPTRTAEEIKRLFTICLQCPYLATDRLRGTYCGKCGCPVNVLAAKPTANKVAMATEHCPLDPPRW